MHTTDRSCRYYIQDVFFWRLAGPVAPTGKAIVHWIGCINAIKSPHKRFKIRHKAHFSFHNLEMLKTRLHSTRAKRKRCYDVRLSRQEGSTRRHLGSAQYYGPASRWQHRTSFSGVWRAGLRRPD